MSNHPAPPLQVDAAQSQLLSIWSRSQVLPQRQVLRAKICLLASAGTPNQEIARRGVCLIPEGRGVFPNLTVRENLWMATHTGTSRARVEAVTFERFPQLGERRRQLAGSLSGG